MAYVTEEQKPDMFVHKSKIHFIAPASSYTKQLCMFTTSTG